MAENTEPTTEPTGDAAEVEAHSSVLDYQVLGKDMDKSESACVSLLSVIEEK